MPDLPSTPPAAAAAALPALAQVMVAPSLDELEIALGCECADPALQIERWLQEARGAEAG